MMNTFRSRTLLALLLFAFGFTAFAQKPYTVVFYNLENFFDTINQPDVLDEEFTPEGPKQWNSAKYFKKLGNVEQVFWNIASRNRDYPTVIGVSELENRNVLEDIVSTPRLARAGYRIVHFDSPDRRGVDVAFLYRPDQFKLEGSAPIPVTIPELPNFRTRDIVTMWGTIEQEPFYFMVTHWPSRLGGQSASEPRRMAAATVMRRAVDSVLKANPATKVVLMGDLNDDPTDRAVAETLGARGKMKELVPGDLYNPFNDVIRAGYGTLAYNDAWNLFDNIIVSENLVSGSTGPLRLQKAPGKWKYYGNIFTAPFLYQQEGQYKGYPLRTFVGNNFQGGYSDHLPVYILIGR